MRKLLVIATILLLSGCSSKLAYKNLDWLAHWYIDDYILLTEEQRFIVDQNLAHWLAWHQQEELPKYLANLNELTSDISTQQLSIEKLTYYQAQIQQHWGRMKAKIVPDLVVLSPLLDDQQVSYLFDKLDKKNSDQREKIEEELALNPEQQQTDTIKKYNKNLTRWLGELTPRQEALAVDMHRKLQPNDSLWLEYRIKYQDELKKLFDKPDRGDLFSEKLFQLLIEPDVFRSDELNQINNENSVYFKKFLIEINSVATEKQRKKLIKEINKYARDAKDLIK